MVATTLDQLSRASIDYDQLGRQRDDLIVAARRAGHTWPEISSAAAMSMTAVQYIWRRDKDDQAPATS